MHILNNMSLNVQLLNRVLLRIWDTLFVSLVGEEDELSIKFAADAVVEALGFEGDVIVSFHT